MTKKEIMDILSTLPKGGITSKKIKSSNGKVYEYHFLQWSENGKQKTRSLKNDEIEMVKKQLEDRKQLKSMLSLGDYSADDSNLGFNSGSARSPRPL